MIMIMAIGDKARISTQAPCHSPPPKHGKRVTSTYTPTRVCTCMNTREQVKSVATKYVLRSEAIITEKCVVTSRHTRNFQNCKRSTFMLKKKFE